MKLKPEVIEYIRNDKQLRLQLTYFLDCSVATLYINLRENRHNGDFTKILPLRIIALAMKLKEADLLDEPLPTEIIPLIPFEYGAQSCEEKDTKESETGK